MRRAYIGVIFGAIFAITILNGIIVSAQTRTYPVGVGTPASLTVRSNFGNQAPGFLRLIVTQVIRGEAAWLRIKQTADYSNPPPPGKEFVLIYLKLDYLDGPNDLVVPLSIASFEVLRNGEYDGKLAFLSLPNPPEPVFGGQSGMDILPHQSTEGWIVKEVYSGDPNPRLVFLRSLDGTGGAYFSIAHTFQMVTETLTASPTATFTPTITPTYPPCPPVVKPSRTPRVSLTPSITPTMTETLMPPPAPCATLTPTLSRTDVAGTRTFKQTATADALYATRTQIAADRAATAAIYQITLTAIGPVVTRRPTVQSQQSTPAQPPAPSVVPPPTQPPADNQGSQSSPGNGATALCNDGTYSYAAQHQGACSHHRGVKVFYK